MTRNRRSLAILVLLPTLAIACGRGDSDPVAQKNSTESSAPSNLEAASDRVDAASEDPVTPESPASDSTASDSTASDSPASDSPASDSPASDSPASSQASQSDEADAPDAVEPDGTSTASADSGAGDTPDEEAMAADQRLILLTAGGPLVIDLTLVINGDSYDAALEALIDRAYESADVDGDGKRTWAEVADSPDFRYGQFGNLAIENEDQRGQLISMYDRNGDRLVDRDELPRFLTRNVGGARAFSLRSSNEYRTDNRSQSPVRLLLDADRDGAITLEEMDQADQLLARQDANDDAVVTPADFMEENDPMAMQMSNRRRTSEPDTAVVLNSSTNWRYVTYALEELYSYGDRVTAADWPLTAGLFATLDQDESGQLERSEMEQLKAVAPHFQLKLSFGADEEGKVGPPRLELIHIADSFREHVQNLHAHPNRVSVTLGTSEVEFFVNEDPSLTRVQEVADQQFQLLDRDGNGYLDNEEITTLPGYDVPFEGLDADGNEQVVLEEIVRFLELRQAAFRGQVRGRAADQRDALFSALDVDGNGRLTEKEIAAAPQTLRELDRNQDGRLQSHEIPGSMIVGFIRGNPQQDNTLLVAPTTTATNTDDRPRWFNGMDANGDGSVSAREFLGATDKFAQFDADSDGFISVEEALP